MCRQAIEMTLETRSHVSKKKDKEAVGARPPNFVGPARSSCAILGGRDPKMVRRGRAKVADEYAVDTRSRGKLMGPFFFVIWTRPGSVIACDATADVNSRIRIAWPVMA
jgi:hypothetical protein